MIIVSTFRSLNMTFEIRRSEWMLSGGILSMGLISFFNPSLYQSPSMSHIIQLAPPDLWTVGLLLLGGLRLTALWINGSWWRTPHLRTIFAFMSCFLWAQIAFGFAPNLGWSFALMPWIFLLDAMNALRAGREIGISEYVNRVRKARNDDTARS